LAIQGLNKIPLVDTEKQLFLPLSYHLTDQEKNGIVDVICDIVSLNQVDINGTIDIILD